MAVSISELEAYGRMIAAGRMLAGLDQAQLAVAARVSPATVSNVERGNDAREDTRRAIRRALRKSGVTVTWDAANGLVAAAVTFEEPIDIEELDESGDDA
jgi:transcriptional regulator with XRE-family HTH domain